MSLLEKLVQPGDNGDGWRQFHDLYRPLLHRWLASAGLQEFDRDEVVQEVLRVVFTDLVKFQRGGSGAFRAWLRAITVNRLREHWRSLHRHPKPTDPIAGAFAKLEDPGSDLSKLWDREHDRHLVRQMLKRIEPDFDASTRHAFERVVLRSEKPAAVALVLGLSVNSVLLAKSRILRRLRQEMRGFLE